MCLCYLGSASISCSGKAPHLGYRNHGNRNHLREKELPRQQELSWELELVRKQGPSGGQDQDQARWRSGHWAVEPPFGSLGSGTSMVTGQWNLRGAGQWNLHVARTGTPESSTIVNGCSTASEMARPSTTFPMVAGSEHGIPPLFSGSESINLIRYQLLARYL